MSCNILGLCEIDTTTVWGKVKACAAVIAVALIIIASVALAGKIVVSVLGSALMLSAAVAVMMLLSCYGSCHQARKLCNHSEIP